MEPVDPYLPYTSHTFLQSDLFKVTSQLIKSDSIYLFHKHYVCVCVYIYIYIYTCIYTGMRVASEEKPEKQERKSQSEIGNLQLVVQGRGHAV